MAKIETKNKQNPKLVQTTLKDGRASLALEYYLGRSESPVLDDEGNQVFYTSGAMSGKPKYKVKHNRKRENLNLYIWIHPRSPQERTQNRNTLALAEKIRFEREQEFLEDREGYRLKKEKEVDLLRYFRKHREDEVYARSTRIGFGTAYRRFIDFLGSMPKYKKYVDFLRMDLLTPEMVGGYVEYLKKVSVGDGGARTYGLFKKVITTAVEEGLMKKNPCKGIAMRKDAYAIKKQILTLDEIRRLASTPFAGSYPDIRRAFLFSLYTGIRWRDVSQLTYENVDLSSGLLKFEQSKIAGRSKSSSVVTPLSPMLHKIIGEPEVHGDCRQLIFSLPTWSTCVKQLDAWVKAAGIGKHITWHCARHSFAVNILNGGANIKTVQSLMGHASIEMTEKYLRVVDELKHKAINSLPELDYE
ncbi:MULTISPECIES: tyrosine-type recombinase/integrase [Muribaculaceae]|jgi:integrase|uniref:Tyrosine-type recombinase/integrase n=1 Tax=Heminiphilus faecis TaxID=2601703 RepID=A0ABV4CWW1_9BACT|nr:site-specific integrase [Duncaniella muris]